MCKTCCHCILIGYDAIIGTNVAITQDIMSYAVVSAKRLRMRFLIMEFSFFFIVWWDWLLDKIHDALPDMQNLLIKSFIHKWKKSSE
ncbi:hypothetical protein [Bartonella doshiae]|uniref:hypothetical protein n=1 Tax=Bartonella doshiae TaxID=33044 RepID=UPI0017934AEB|nr:hypothetical protein [Bartonella doshiae]